ncbi:allophanate hydrolase [Dactylosporangium sp. AC04546]|uniref:allophanate hydrolase n=1 Tax=Dactylosporangium sp. AC04546 TaxID=2862460 RepID=UPI001EDF40D1|nr:allophanate hydrolase [Dactylosporangium sp. AC04546]WVK85890.1 allophanate hydrolase [Dactylosporangium sp. AC04546]
MLAIAGLRTAYLRGELKPAEVADRVAAAPAPPAVWISRVPEEALRDRAAELGRRDPRELPLYGIPFAVKDNIDVAGLPTTAACPAFAYTPARSAPVVDRLLAAGALLVGKTNLDQFATGLTGSRSPYGAVESVFGGGLIAGGSSSGSAVAVAAGLVAFALGTDTAGSGRVPAALNGIVGLKPTRGLLSTAGVVPACRSLDCVSIFAQDAADAAAVLSVASGPAADDPWCRVHEAAGVPPEAVRLGVARPETLDFDGDRGQAERYVAGCLALARRTASADPVDVGPLLEAGGLLYDGPWVAERLADLEDFLRDHGADVLPLTRGIIEGGRRFSAADTFRARHRLQELRAATARLFERIDVLALPTIPTTFTLDEIAAEPLRRNAVLGRFTQFANLLDLAVVTVPNGHTPDGRPASLSLIGPAFTEPTLLGLAGAPVAATGTEIAVVGHHLRGEARNGELVALGGRFVRATRTAPCYRLFYLATGVPGLVRVADGGVAIEVEVWSVPPAAVGALLGSVPPPLSLGHVSLASGERVTGFLCEAYATADGLDISASGGWRAFRALEAR